MNFISTVTEPSIEDVVLGDPGQGSVAHGRAWLVWGSTRGLDWPARVPLRGMFDLAPSAPPASASDPSYDPGITVFIGRASARVRAVGVSALPHRKVRASAERLHSDVAPVIVPVRD